MNTDRREIEVPGHSWITGAKPPEIEGWECFWVNHYGSERTVFVYQRTARRA